MKKMVLFLCGGRWQEPWVKFLKEKGHQIILVDPNINPICKKYADVYFQEDVKQVDAIFEFISKGEFEIEFVTSDQTDVATIPVAILSQKFNTPAIPLEVVEKFTNKFLSRDFVASIDNTHVPNYAQVVSLECILTFVESSTCDKFIIKPANAQSSRGIEAFDNNVTNQDLEYHLQHALLHSTTGYAVVEEFVNGTEITIEGIVIDRKHHIMAASRKKHFRMGIASELAYPLVSKNEFLDRIFSFHSKIIEATKIPFGITHSEYIINETTQEFWLVEMACRGGGSLIPSHIVPWVSQIELYPILYNALTKQTTTGLSFEVGEAKKAAVLHFFEFKEGVVKTILGLDECSKMKGVVLIDLEFKPGDSIKSASDDRGRQGFAIVFGDNLSDCYLVINQLYERINIEYEL